MSRARLAARLVLLLLVACLAAGCPPPSPPGAGGVEAAPGQLDARRWLAAAAGRARAAGAGELLPLGAGVLAEGEQLGGFVLVAADRCVLALARAGPAVSDVDLLVFSDGGDQLAADEAPDAGAAVLVCPPHPERLYVLARVVRGTGPLGLGALPVPRAAADAVARAVQARGWPGYGTGKLAGWPGLEGLILRRRRQLGSSWQDLRRLILPLRPTAYSAVTVPIAPHSCVDALVLPGESVRSIDLIAQDRHGRVIARASSPDRSRALLLCSQEEPQQVTLLVRPHSSSGVAAVVVSRSAPDALSELAEGVRLDGVTALRPLGEALPQHRRRLAEAGLAEPAQVVETTLAAGPVELPLVLQPGCTRLDVVGGIPLGAFEAELWTDDGRRLAAARGGGTAALFTCGAQLQAVRLELRAVDLPGPLAVELRLEPAPSPLLLDHSLAAARLLGRLEAGAGPISAAAVGAVQALSLSAGSRRSLPLEAPAGRCVEVIAALSGPPEGLALRIRPDDGSPGSLRRGREVVSERLCGSATAAAKGSIELSVDRGPAELLLLLHQSAAGPPPPK